jgi:hypothetical protein
MTVYTLEASMPDILMVGGSFLRFEAIDPTTGLAVTGVTVDTISVYGTDESEQTGNLESGPFVLVPGPGAGGDSAAEVANNQATRKV